MNPLETSWESSIGTVTVTTHRGNGQSIADWETQHEEAVSAAMAIWPEID